jgi:hypothetical protein
MVNVDALVADAVRERILEGIDLRWRLDATLALNDYVG